MTVYLQAFAALLAAIWGGIQTHEAVVERKGFKHFLLAAGVTLVLLIGAGWRILQLPWFAA